MLGYPAHIIQELSKAKQKLPPGIELVKADDLKEWWVDIRVLGMHTIRVTVTPS